MRIRQVTYPILVCFPQYVAGGRAGGFAAASRFDFNLADYYRTGVWDSAVVVDSQGREFTVETIEFSRPARWRYLLHYASDLFIPNSRWRTEMVDVDMRLARRRSLDLATLTRELRDMALARPDWWGDMTKVEIQALFTGHATIADLIETIGFLGPDHEEEEPNDRSTKILDLRQITAPAAPPPG